MFFVRNKFDPNEDYIWKIGPWIGLYQIKGGREPDGGWKWEDETKLTYSHWGELQPDNNLDIQILGRARLPA